ncbi:hypothetical protein RHGRI_026016 [Rhododendron griersonianum]|uniref:F-box associated beta-propeller type 1 domain-containing protein n=1 Tax=Rhododendron griersonianum TaxID=479676 RepID=A0AAV6IRA5_9ERIC|nr:hypothetical protein RHGRI_026016 [Rhododendron griersonianum]
MCSCDGLILLSVDERCFSGTKSGKSFVLWNPSNRSHKRISCPYQLPFVSQNGICYDSTDDDYKVFILSTKKYESCVVIYSLRNDSWNMFIDSRYDTHVVGRQAVVNRAVHWVMYSNELESGVIVYFDLVEEKFKEVPPPSSWKLKAMKLIELGGHLCVYCDIGVKKIEVYAIKEYGKKESWARLFVIPCAIERKILVEPLCLTKKGQVLISVGENGIGIYDPKYRTFLLYDSVRGRMAIPYVKTLVSLNGGV